MMDRVEQRLGNYRLVRLLGRGGFAQRSDDTFSAYYRLPGQSWQLINTANASLQNVQAGLLLVNMTNAQFTANFHYFKVTCN